eukprot:513698_1
MPFFHCVGCWLKYIPFVSRFFMLIIILIYIVQWLFDTNETGIWLFGCLMPVRLLYGPKKFWFSFITHHFLHKNIYHILMNLFSIIIFFPNNERKLGSVTMFLVTIISMIPISILIIILSYILHGFTVKDTTIISTWQCNLGFSDVIWVHTMIYIIKDDAFGAMCKALYFSPFLIFDLFVVPYCWPWLNISVVGHLSGFMVGILYCMGFPGFALFRNKCVRKIEDSACLECCSNRNCFALTPFKKFRQKKKKQEMYADKRSEKELIFSDDGKTVVTFGNDMKYLFDVKTSKWTLIEEECKSKNK